VRLGDGKRLIFDWKKANKGKVTNYKPKHKTIDMDLWSHNIRVKVRLNPAHACTIARAAATCPLPRTHAAGRREDRLL